MLTNCPTDSTLDILKLKDGVDTSSYCAMKNIYISLGFLCFVARVMNTYRMHRWMAG